jgi:hypothetical protein
MKNQDVTEGNREQPLEFNFPETRSYAEEKLKNGIRPCFDNITQIIDCQIPSQIFIRSFKLFVL